MSRNVPPNVEPTPHTVHLATDPDAIRAKIRQSRAKAAQEQAEHIRRITADHKVNDGADHGPDVRVERGDIERCDRQDIDAPPASKSIITTYRVKDGLQTALDANVIDTRQFKAGERLRDDIAIASGARDRQIGMPRTSSTAEPGQSQIDAIRRVERARAFVSSDNLSVIEWVVVNYLPLYRWILKVKIRYSQAREMGQKKLSAGLDELEDFYDGQKKRY